jgi:hypothetical protein
MSTSEEVLEYRPSRTAAVVLGTVFVTTGVVLAVLGALLTESDVSGMDGLQRLLFSVVSVRWFSWAMAAVFAALGVRIVARGFRAAPALILEAAGLTLGGEERTPWDHVDEIRTLPKPPVLQLRLGDRVVSLSSFDLGDDPAAVAERMAQLRTRSPAPE